ncbi:MAG: hypothetical protein KIS66_10400 [Fimbriimonadaceae bacterium]|nr:hypothetical protein [Fimbriimonadaceae bacterium]
MRQLAVLGLLVLGAIAFGQSAKPSPSARPTDLLTEGEMWAVMNQVEMGVSKVLGVRRQLVKVKLENNGRNPATREAVIAKLDKLFEMSRPAFKFTPQPQPVDASVLKGTAPTLATLKKLIAWGAMAPRGPLATGGATVTLAEYGDAVGYLVSAIASLTHTPSSVWSPYLMPNDPAADERFDKKPKTTGGGRSGG